MLFYENQQVLVQGIAKDTKSSVGNRGERIAAMYLERLGFHIAFRSYRTAMGEIDVIAISHCTWRDNLVRTLRRHRLSKWMLGRFTIENFPLREDRQIVFVEVKTWNSIDERHRLQGEGPSQAVDERKQRKLTMLAAEFLKQRRMLESPARFDVIGVILNPVSVRHFPNAFEAVGLFQWFV